MAKGRETSDDRVVPNSPRKRALTADVRRGGKAVTISKQAGQLQLFPETADSPQGAVDDTVEDRSSSASLAVPKSRNAKSELPAMTMDEVARIGNLMRAFEEVAANRGAPGPDRRSIDDVRKHLPSLLPLLRSALLDGSYQPGMIRRVWIPKASGGMRGLGIPNVIDRLVQQAVHQVLSPDYESSFNEGSHGFRPGRSCHTAITAGQQHIEDGYSWVVDLDLEKFFDRVHHDRLLSRLAQRCSDRALLLLIRRMLKAKVVMPDGVVVATDEGTPQGGPLSPLLSNIVLDELDEELSRRGHRFVRYADDCNIYVRSERAGQRVMASIVRFIEERLRLRVNREKSAVALPQFRHFLGFRLKRRPVVGDVEVLLSWRSVKRAFESIRLRLPRTAGHSAGDLVVEINRYLRGWIGFFGICSGSESYRTIAMLDARVRRRLRALLLRQWKRKLFIVRRLVRLGVRPAVAWRGIYAGRRSTWALSETKCVEMGLSNGHFARLGLLCLLDEWKRLRRERAIAASQMQLRWDS